MYEDKFDQIYNLIAEIAEESGNTWLKVYAALLLAHAATESESDEIIE